MFLETTAREAGEGGVRCVGAETDLAIKVCYQRGIKRDLLSIWILVRGFGTQMERRVSRVWSSMSEASLEGRSETALERVVGSRFWMFLRMTTRSGGRADRSSGLVVDDSGDDGVKPAKLPNAPKSETEPNGELLYEKGGFGGGITQSMRLGFLFLLAFGSSWLLVW
jgi:hypothetical protein